MKSIYGQQLKLLESSLQDECNPDKHVLEQFQKSLISNQAKFDGLMTTESAMLTSWSSKIQSILGKFATKLGPKARAMFKDIAEIKRLLNILLHSNCVMFYEELVDLRLFGAGRLANESENPRSIFRFCDDHTESLILSLVRLAKERIYEIKDRV